MLMLLTDLKGYYQDQKGPICTFVIYLGQYIRNGACCDQCLYETHTILVTAASQRLNITDPMTVEEFTNADTDAPASEQLTDNWEQQLVDDCVTGTTDADCDEDTQEDTHVL